MQSATHFDRLEQRQLMAVDLSASTAVPVGAYGADDLFDVTISLKNAGNSSSDLPLFVNVVLSKDTKLGNADDIVGFSGTVFLGAKAGKTATMEPQVHVQDTWAAGDYYVITQADPYNSQPESNEKNNVTVSKNKDIRIVRDVLKPGTIVNGTAKNDVITIQGNFANEIITVNGVSKRVRVAGSLEPIKIQGGKGDDKITCDAGVDLRYILSGNAGNDTITGGNANDTLYGDAGNDRLYGGKQADLIYGGSGNDIIDGGADTDRIFGEAGKDKAVRSTQDIFNSVETML